MLAQMYRSFYWCFGYLLTFFQRFCRFLSAAIFYLQFQCIVERACKKRLRYRELNWLIFRIIFQELWDLLNAYLGSGRGELLKINLAELQHVE